MDKIKLDRWGNRINEYVFTFSTNDGQTITAAAKGTLYSRAKGKIIKKYPSFENVTSVLKNGVSVNLHL